MHVILSSNPNPSLSAQKLMAAMTVFSLFLLLTLLPPAFSMLCHPQDRKALLQIKKDLNNPYILISWNPKEQADCCDWNNLDCDEKTHRVINVMVVTDDVSAQIPPSIGQLPYLQSLEFHKLPNLTGPIQPAIAKLTNLKYLFLSWNNLSGPVPDFLGQLKNLELIDLSFNNLYGSIPPSLSQLPNLLSLDISRNKLTGPIPESFGSFKSNPDLRFSHNQLTGTIPKSLAKLKSERIDFSRNKFRGDASVLFGSKKPTQILDLSRNLLSFDLSKVQFATTLITLDLNHNKIYGSIPEQLTAVDFLQSFNVSYNMLCGKIPASERLKRFDEYSYLHNKCLCGSPLPSCK